MLKHVVLETFTTFGVLQLTDLIYKLDYSRTKDFYTLLKKGDKTLYNTLF